MPEYESYTYEELAIAEEKDRKTVDSYWTGLEPRMIEGLKSRMVKILH